MSYKGSVVASTQTHESMEPSTKPNQPPNYQKLTGSIYIHIGSIRFKGYIYKNTIR